MNKKIATLILLLSITILLVILFTSFNRVNEEKDTISKSREGIIYVNENNTLGPWYGTPNSPYQTVQDGILNATDNDIIYIFNGVYSETIIIDKPIILCGENPRTTILDGMYSDFVIKVTIDNAQIKNLTIRNSGGFNFNAGINIISDNTLVKNCILYRTKTGIYIDNAYSTRIDNCTFYNNGEGLFLKTSSGNSVNNCQFSNNAIGLHSQSSNKIEVENSYAHTNGIGFFLNDSSNIMINHCAICDNNDNQGGVFLTDCVNVDFANCNICHNGFGIILKQSSLIRATFCDLKWNTHNAMRIGENSKDVTISNCEITDNFRYGITISEESKCKIANNNFNNNRLYGLYSKNSYCEARKNWWGGITGPAVTELGGSDRATRSFGKTLYFPWSSSLFDNIGSDWETNNVFSRIEPPGSKNRILVFNDVDADADGIPDWWEKKWGYESDSWDDHSNLDPDEDALNNFEECYADAWGSNPFEQDIFLEFDWIESMHYSEANKPSADLIGKVIDAFAEHNINLHVDVGNLGGGEEIPYISHFSYADLRDLYWDYFLHNDLNNPRKGIFHYCLVCDYGPGEGFAFVGWDQLDSFDISAQMLVETQPLFNKERLIVHGALHELGHTLGLFVDDHGGNDNSGATKPFTIQFWKYKNYRSCMNYMYTYRILGFSDGSHGKGDFNDWDNLDLSFFKNSHWEWPKE